MSVRRFQSCRVINHVASKNEIAPWFLSHYIYKAWAGKAWPYKNSKYTVIHSIYLFI